MLSNEPGCNCPPLHDVFRHRMYTKPLCPVHPTTAALADMLIPRIPVEDMEINLAPIDPLPGQEKS